MSPAVIALILILITILIVVFVAYSGSRAIGILGRMTRKFIDNGTNNGGTNNGGNNGGKDNGTNIDDETADELEDGKESFIALMNSKGIDSNSRGEGYARIRMDYKNKLANYIVVCRKTEKPTCIKIYRENDTDDDEVVKTITDVTKNGNEWVANGVWKESDKRYSLDYDCVADLNDERLYVIIETNKYPSGEIGGDLRPDQKVE